jgi:hypothetical protein
MPSTEQTTASAIAKTLLRLLRPLVRILLRNGFAFGDLAEVMKKVYVEVADQDFVLPGKKNTIARIATITGLTRKEVQRIKNLAADDFGDAGQQQFNRAARVISAWIRDPRFSNNGQPLPLLFQGDMPNFSELVRLHSGDIPARAVLDELFFVNAIEEDTEGYLHLKVRAYIPCANDASSFYLVGESVADLLETLQHNLAFPKQPYFQRRVAYDAIPSADVPLLQKALAAMAQQALEDMNALLAKYDLDTRPNAGVQVQPGDLKRLGVGIYYFLSTSQPADEKEGNIKKVVKK